MEKPEQIAWKWLINQPALSTPATVSFPVDKEFNAMLDKVGSMFVAVPPLAEAIRQRILLYAKAGYKGTATRNIRIKSALRDYLEAIQ